MKITLGTTYYENPECIKLFIQHHIDYVDELIIVDDGSQNYPLSDVVSKSEKMRMFRVKRDYGFNSHGCRNLIMKKVSTDFVVLMDSDRLVERPEYSFDSIKKRNLKFDILYRFLVSGENPHKSVNDFLISKQHFFSAGGYDEELIGVRAGDREYFRQLKHFGKEKTLYDISITITRGPSLLHKNNVSKNDKSPSYRDLNIVYNRIKNPEPKKPILTFEWEEL